MVPVGKTLRAGAIVALAALLVPLACARAAERLPIFDTHVHYSRGAWETYPPARVIALMDEAGVPRALVSSTPDDGTLMLHREAPGRIVPILRPYRSSADMGDWVRSQEVLDYVLGRAARGPHRGLGEFHLFDAAEADTAQVRELARLAGDRDLVLHVHSGAGAIRRLFAMQPGLKIIWAHAGMSAPPEVVREMLDSHANLWTELSFRAADVAPGGEIDPAWRALLLAHPGRFMIGTDTYVTARWAEYPALVERHRHWVSQLPPEAARAIAHGNATRLFGAGPLGSD